MSSTFDDFLKMSLSIRHLRYFDQYVIEFCLKFVFEFWPTSGLLLYKFKKLKLAYAYERKIQFFPNPKIQNPEAIMIPPKNWPPLLVAEQNTCSSMSH